jgi:hypothetical protein
MMFSNFIKAELEKTKKPPFGWVALHFSSD